MKPLAPILCCVLLIVGGSMLLTSAGTVEVPVTYAIMPAADSPAHIVPVQPDANGTAVPVDPLAENMRLVSAAGCPNGLCPFLKPNKTAKTSTAVAGEEGARRPLRAVAAGVCSRACGVVRFVIGRERRQTRRANR